MLNQNDEYTLVTFTVNVSVFANWLISVVVPWPDV